MYCGSLEDVAEMRRKRGARISQTKLFVLKQKVSYSWIKMPRKDIFEKNFRTYGSVLPGFGVFRSTFQTGVSQKTIK